MLFCSCTSGCRYVGGITIARAGVPLVFDYQCLDSCEWVFGGISQRWSIFKLDIDSGELDEEDLSVERGNLIASKLCTKCTQVHVYM